MKTRPVAALIMIVLIIAAVYIGALKSLVRLSAQVDKAFTEDNSVQHDLDEIAIQCNNIADIAKKYFNEKDIDIIALDYARTKLSNSATTSEKHDANNHLSDKTAVVFNRLKSVNDITDSDLGLMNQYYNEIQLLNTDIINNDYNRIAEEYNRLLSRFPTSLVAKIIGSSPAELFD